MEHHTTDTQPSRLFIADNADVWATIDMIRNDKVGNIDAMTDEGWADSLGYDENRLVKIASSVKSRRGVDTRVSLSVSSQCSVINQ
jgi:hypothetical protein